LVINLLVKKRQELELNGMESEEAALRDDSGQVSQFDDGTQLSTQ